jgi:hypothetical protein
MAPLRDDGEDGPTGRVMQDAGNTFRLAIGIFHDMKELASAIGELTADGVTAAEIGLVGTRQAIDAFRSAPRKAGEGLLAGDIKGLAPHVNGIELFATDSRLVRKLLEHTAPSDGAGAAAHHWLLSDLFGSLTEHLREGAVALLVGAGDFARQRRGSRILLRNTGYTVQVHEFMPRPSAAPNSTH